MRLAVLYEGGVLGIFGGKVLLGTAAPGIVARVAQAQPVWRVDDVGVDAVGGVAPAGDERGKDKAGVAALKVDVGQLVHPVQVHDGADVAGAGQPPECGGLGAVHCGSVKCVQGTRAGRAAV